MCDEFKPARADEITQYSDKSLTEVLTPEVVDEAIQEVVQSSDSVDEDFEQVRQNLKNIIEKGDSVLEEMIELAKASEHPRAYEVASTLINTLVSANKDLIEIHQKKEKLKPAKTETPQTVNNNLFVGTSTDLLDIINKS